MTAAPLHRRQIRCKKEKDAGCEARVLSILFPRVFPPSFFSVSA
jgi:hypothetical protein